MSSSASSALPLATGGVVSRADLVRGDVDRSLGDRLVRAGLWVRLAPSTYLTGPGPPTEAQLVDAARRHVGERLVVTGLVACRALELPDVPTGRSVAVLVPRGTRAVTTPYVQVHQTARAPATWTEGGVRYAMPDRAVVDAARSLSDLRAVRALVLGAVCRGAVAASDLRLELEAGPRRDSALLRRVIHDAVAGAWSAPEAEAADLVADAVRRGRLPPFALNALVSLRGQVIGRLDGYLVGTGVGWQVDSRRHHSEGDDFDRTLAVHDAYAAAGITLLHVTPRRVRRDGSAWVGAVAGAVRARPGQRDPPGVGVVLHAPLQDGRRRWARPSRSCAASVGSGPAALLDLHRSCA